MNKEIFFYLNILKDFINKNKTSVPGDIDWNLLKQYSFIQNTNGIVYYQCKEFMPSEVLNYFNRLYMAEIYNYGKRINITKEIINSFNTNNITYCLVKGPIVADNYPIPALRTMGDSDFVVKEKDCDKAYKLMDELGYSLEASLTERAYYKNNMEVEIHNALVYENNGSDKDKEFSDRIWDYVKDNKLDESYHFVFLLIHLKKHILVSGCGFRQFMDLAIEIANSNLNWQFIDNEVEKLGMNKFMNTCLSLTYKWFNIKRSDKEVVELDEDFLNETTLKILNNGVHGFESDDNKANSAFETMSKSENINFFSKIKYILELYFPPFSYFKNDTNYKFLRKCPLLLPIAWIYRFILSIRNNNALFEIKRSIKGLFMSRKEIDKRLSNKDKWGL